MPKQTEEQLKKDRIFIFIAYSNDGFGDMPIFSKLFNNHEELKDFSAKYSSEYKRITIGYHSTYLDLKDKSLLSQKEKETREQVVGECVEAIEKLKIKINIHNLGHYKPECNMCGYNECVDDSIKTLTSLSQKE